MNRTEILARLSDPSEDWDVIIIGGGATGLGIAVDAASRGYRTALLEQADFAESTSSKSTKLIHGGVRYLRGGEVGLVRESLRERGRLLRNAPGLVEPLPFVVPAYRWYERFFYGSGLTLYDLLAGDLGVRSTGHLSQSETLSQIPNLRSQGLYGGTLYWDGQFDDARLAVAMARTAVEHGGAVANHVRVEELVKESGRVTGVVATDQIGGETFRLAGKVVINATGVFTDSVRRMDEGEVGDLIAPSQGIHIVLDQKFLGGDTAIMIPSTDDGRVLFAIPWKGKMLLGTTDTGDVSVELHPRPLEEEVDYLIDHAGRYLAEKPTLSDIRSTFAGLRPLVKPSDSDSQQTSKISRSHYLSVSDSGLVTMAGGKWTTYRQMAEDAVDRAIEVGELETRPCLTHDLTLLGGEKGSPDESVSDGDLEPVDPDLPYTKSDIRAAIREEMGVTLADVLCRRTRAMFLDTEAALRSSEKVLGWMTEELQEGASWAESQREDFKKELASYILPTSLSPS